jgi:hypothetical protein
MRAFTAAERPIYHQLRETADEVAKLTARQKSLPARIPLSESPDAEKAMRLSTEHKHLSNVLKMVAYRTEGSLMELLRPVYPRTEDEGRTLIQTALRSTATIEPREAELRVTLAPFSLPHRSQAIASVCEELNNPGALFPRTKLPLWFPVAQSPL